jgi:3-isopropylmalate/(R)-2-methylmalate dehydratase small subunit
MLRFTELTSLVVPLDRPNVDTDAIIPKQFLKSIQRTGFGVHLFDEWRYRDSGFLGQDCSRRPLNAQFPLNQARYQSARILLARENFGCGSSREHAVWALLEYGFRAVIAPSFGDIFYNNCFKNGLLPIVLPSDTVTQIFTDEAGQGGYLLHIDLAAQVIVLPTGKRYCFEIDPGSKTRLLKGLDEIGATLELAPLIRDYEARRQAQEPWLFAVLHDHQRAGRGSAPDL